MPTSTTTDRSRRRFLAGAGATAGALLLSPPTGALAQGLGVSGASRASKLFPGVALAHGDLHNHTLLSDGDGDPAAAFESMRAAGLDAAALTDHAVLGGPLGKVLGGCTQCTSVRGIDDDSWARTARLADGADDPTRFCAIRGFEWSSPTLGHVNVWGSSTWVDPERTLGLVGLRGLPEYLHEVPVLGPAVGEPLAALVDGVPAVGDGAMSGFYRWLARDPGGTVGGGGDGVAGFNHPGREPARFAGFAYDPKLADRMVSIEMFNRRDDYLYEGTDHGRPSPLVHCLDAGWRVGILGVTDEHGTDWGYPEGKGRTGLWVRELTRDGVLEAMLARRFFATNVRGLRLDASAAGIQMGQPVPHDRGPLELRLDIDKGIDWTGKRLLVQVLQTGDPMPTVTHTEEVRVPGASEPPLAFTAEVSRDDGAWVVLRIVDPDQPADERAIGDYQVGKAVAYASPFFLDQPPSGVVPEFPNPALVVDGGVLGLGAAVALSHHRRHGVR